MKAKPHFELQAEAIQRARRVSASIVGQSEKLRETIDQMETALLVVTGTECAVSAPVAQKLFDRLQNIRALRNTMEAFEFDCRVQEAMAKAWEALP